MAPDEVERWVGLAQGEEQAIRDVDDAWRRLLSARKARAELAHLSPEDRTAALRVRQQILHGEADR